MLLSRPTTPYAPSVPSAACLKMYATTYCHRYCSAAAQLSLYRNSETFAHGRYPAATCWRLLEAAAPHV